MRQLETAMQCDASLSPDSIIHNIIKARYTKAKAVDEGKFQQLLWRVMLHTTPAAPHPSPASYSSDTPPLYWWWWWVENSGDLWKQCEMKIWHVLIAFITHWVILYCHRHPQHTSGSGDVFIIRLSEDIKQKPLMSHGVIYMPWQPLSSAIINPEILLILSKISENFNTWDGKGGSL